MERHLADMFPVMVSTVSRVYTTWVRFLALTLKGSLLRWPSKEEINAHMPTSFSNYPSTRVIMNCAEFFLIQKPSSPSAQKATWSDYKHHNTVKLLILFLFVLFLLLSDSRLDVQGVGVLLKRVGFLTKKEVKLNIPPFSKGKKTRNGNSSSIANRGKVRLMSLLYKVSWRL